MHDPSCDPSEEFLGGRSLIAGPVAPVLERPVLRVRFSDPDEFAAELRARDPDVEKVVRVAFRWRRDPQGLPCRHLSVVAGYLRSAREGVLVLSELVYYAGEVWDGLNEEVSARTRERAEHARQVVARAADEQFVKLAAGVYRTPDERGPIGAAA